MRKKTNRRKDQAMFKRTANRTRAVNVSTHIVPRGGIRL